LRIVAAILCALALLGSTMLAVAERRVALVIGNSDYAIAPKLRNPRNDAAAMIDKLQQLGFEVFDGLDADKLALGQKLKEFGRATQNADVALFFYAGHGIQVDGQNFLVPTDAHVQFEEEIPLELLSLNTVLRQMERGSRINIVFLDACRDNPFAEELSRSVSTRGAVSLGKGLGEVRTVPGTYIAFATDPNRVAADGSGDNSPFTEALLKHIDTPGSSIQDMMIRVRREVSTATNGVQTPWDSSSLMEPFAFVPAAATAQVASAPDGAVSSVRDDFHLAMAMNSCGAIDAFLATHPNAGMLTSLARAKRDELCVPSAQAKPADEPQQLAMAMRAIRPAGTCADGPGGVRYCATSVLPAIGRNVYAPANLFDGRNDTAWVENDPGDGIGETITLEFGRDRQLAGFEIMNGYDKDQRTWSNNSRVSRFELAMSDGRRIAAELPDRRGMNSFEFGAPVYTRSLELTILDVYPGDKYRDTAISQLLPIFAD